MKNNLISYSFLLLSSLVIVGILFFPILSNGLDSTFISGYGDGLKNYYTFIYQSLYGNGLHFKGMNYPYGEFLTYTDAQPLIYLICKSLGLINSVNDGILIVNLIVIGSQLITPLIIYEILKRNQLPDFFAIVCSLFIAFNSPQLLRVVTHYALSYSWIIPLVHLQYLKYLDERKMKHLSLNVLISIIAGLLHPYYSLILFLLGTSITLVFFLGNRQNSKSILYLIASFILPFLFNFLLIKSLDTVNDRIEIPWGSKYYVTHLEHILSSCNGNMKAIWSNIISLNCHTEGDSYLGIVFLLTLLIIVLRQIKRSISNKHLSINSKNYIVLAAFPLLFFGMGIHQDILSLFNIDFINKELAQFRSLARVTWGFYYIITPFLAYKLHQLIAHFKLKNVRYSLLGLAFLLFLNDFISEFNSVKRQIRRFTLSYNSREILNNYDDYQAILCLPYFHIGSEKLNMEERSTFNDAIEISLKSGLPLINTMLSRTSISQTKKQVKLLSNNNQKSVLEDLNNQPILVVKGTEKLLRSNEKKFVSKAAPLNIELDKSSLYRIKPNQLSNNESIKKADYIFSQNIKSKNYQVKETINLNLKNTPSDSINIWVYHKFDNKIYSFPKVELEENDLKRLTSYSFEIIEDEIVFKIPFASNKNSINITFEGVGIDVSKIEIYKD